MLLRITLAATLALATAPWCRPVDADLAAQAARAQLARPQGEALAGLTAVLPQPDGAPTLWLAEFANGGFAWIRGDDRLPPVAGWSPDGDASWPVESPALADWLDLQRQDLEWARTQDWTHPAAADAWLLLAQGGNPERDERVAPMLSSTWDQGWSWNQYCPADAAGPGGHVWAGCVATAMAQVMYFWQWPDVGGGSHGYVHNAYGYQFADFGATAYAWEQMLPGTPTPAAALLQYHCGVAVNMDYAPSGSGAWVGTNEHNALEAFKDYFRYAREAHFIQHFSYTPAAWAARLAAEIEAGRPVLDSGYGSGGHAFVLDGLQSGDQFHVNWGWSGWFNGWYGLEALTPGGGNFSLMQGAIVDLQPDTPPVVAVPDLAIAAGQVFPLLHLDDLVSDAHNSADEMIWWVESAGPFDLQLDDEARTVAVGYPEGWTGSGVVELCAMDPNGMWNCDSGLLTVAAPAQAPVAISDLRLDRQAEGLRLEWTPPVVDIAGNPVLITGYRVFRAAQPWFIPAPANQVASLPGDATLWFDGSALAAGTGFYRVVAIGQ